MLDSRKQVTLKEEATPAEEVKFSTRAKIWTVAILAGLLIVYLLHVWEALPPFIWAAVTAFVFNGPLRSLGHRFGGPRWAWATGIYLLFLSILVAALILIIPAITREARVLATDAPNIKRTVDDYLANNSTVSISGLEVPSESLQAGVNNVLDRLPQLAQELGPSLLSKTFRFMVDLLLYLISTFYLLTIGGRVIWRFIESLPLTYRGELRRLVMRADTVLGAYIKGQFLLVLIMSSASFIFLSIVGIRYALTLGIMTGFLELIPFVGPYLAISVCSLVAFFQPHGPGLSFGLDGLTVVVVVIAGLFILRQIEDLVVIPNVIGRIVELPPLLVIFSTITAAALLGPMGLLLGVPVVAVLKIIFGYLYYKLVDAEREKVFLKPATTFEEFTLLLQGAAPKSRLLLVVAPESVFWRDEAAIQQINELSLARQLDLAFNFNENEKTAQIWQAAGFPIVTMSQEHFLVANSDPDTKLDLTSG